MLAIAVTVLDLLVLWLAGWRGLVLTIVVLISITLMASIRYAVTRPAGLKLDFAGRLRWFLGEVAAALSLFLFWLPAERWMMARDNLGPRRDAAPVLLIHGYVNNAGALWRLWQRLCAAGLRVHTINLEPVYADIDTYAPRIAARIDAIRTQTGADAVTLVCHSMGGLAARAYLRHCQLTERAHGVTKIVTLGTPHHGTVFARIERSANGRQMHPHSPWLTALADHERGAWPCTLVSIYSVDDNVVAPQTSADLAGARNVPLAGIGHISLPLARRVIDLVLAEVASPVNAAHAAAP